MKKNRANQNKGKPTSDKALKEQTSSNKREDKTENLTESKSARIILYLVMVLIPAIFFVLLETGLRIFDYGYDYTQWVNPTKGKYILNPDIAHKYFHNIDNVPKSNQDIFDEIKKSKTFRVFVLGESAGAGYPFTPLGAFSRYLEQKLSLQYPDSKIEVINCSITAINTYTMRDLFPGILEQKPDLVLIYAGHNEYYGALGVGSMESLGTSRSMVNLVIYLEQFKTFQLIRNLLKSAAGLLGGKKEALTGTLMARMAQNQYIGLDSDTYKKGIEQFSGNMHDILEMAKEQNVPVILSTLACNLKDQYPFVSIKEKEHPAADKVYLQAKESLVRNDIKTADLLFRYAKDLDALRFRAPSEINNLIINFGKEFNFAVVNADSLFDAISPDHITGDNLMIDHLHPTLRGYQIIGDVFYKGMKEMKILPKTKPKSWNDRELDSLTVANFAYTRLDSIISEDRIKILKNDWPYVNAGSKIPNNRLFKPKDYIDSIAYEITSDRMTWETAHSKAASWYANRNDLNSFFGIMNVLISQYPIVVEYYDYAANILLSKKDYDKAYYFLIKRNGIEPTAYSTKWIGIINLYKNHLDVAEDFLNQSLDLDKNDSQVWYNLAGVYVNKKKYIKALELVNRALSLESNYQEALALKIQLQKAIK